VSVPREPIDSALYGYFEDVSLDVEAARQQIEDTRNRKLEEVRALLAEAEREAQRAADRLARVRRHFQDGKLDADDWREQREQLTSEQQAATAEATRLREQEAEVEDWGELQDVEEQTLRRLADIRQAIAGEIKDAEGLEAVRAALARLFEGFVLHRLDEDGKLKLGPNVLAGEQPEQVRSELLAGSQFVIELRVREEAIEGYDDESYRPILRREGLGEADTATKLRTL